MSAGKDHVFGVTISRQSKSTPWGIRIVGGNDLGTPIIVTRILSGTPAERHLLRGDIIRKIGDYDTRDVSHQDANNLFINAGNTIKLDIQRDPRTHGSHGRSQSSLDVPSNHRLPVSRPPSALSEREHSRPGTPGGVMRGAPSPRTIVFPPPNPYGEDEEEPGYESYTVEENAEENIAYQPYRTTPLVLPGAKAKHEKELAPTESYLRHHPNPGMRAPPPQHIFLPHEVLMKQKVADSVIQRVATDETLAGKQIVHKQFNTPIGLYSDANITDTIQHQTGVTPTWNTSVVRPAGRSMGPKKTIVYDPAKSETFKALQEDKYGDQVEEVASPVQTKVFTPNVQKQRTALQPPPTHTYDPLSRTSASPLHHGPHINSMGHADDNIAQSGSFRRLMNLVLGESEF